MEGAKSGSQYSLDMNFGELEFDWESRSVQGRIHGLDEETPLLSLRWTMDELSGGSPMNGSLLHTSDFEAVSDQAGPWICAHHRGLPNTVHVVLGQAISLFVLTTLVFLPFITILCATILYLRRSRNSK